MEDGSASCQLLMMEGVETVLTAIMKLPRMKTGTCLHMPGSGPVCWHDRAPWPVQTFSEKPAARVYLSLRGWRFFHKAVGRNRKYCRAGEAPWECPHSTGTVLSTHS